MQQPLPTGVPTLTAPSFYITGRQPLRPGAILLAIVAAVAALSSVLYALGHTGHAHLTSDSSGAARSASATPEPPRLPTRKTIHPRSTPSSSVIPPTLLCPPAAGDHVSPVHPTILVRLPRFGDQVGLIPDTPAGRLLYNWLAAFNQASYPALGNALPNVALASAAAAQIELRQQTGGFNLLSAKEVQPGVLVFRLRDQTPSANRGPRHPPGASELQPRRHRELQPPRRSPTPPGRRHCGCAIVDSLIARKPDLEGRAVSALRECPPLRI